MARDITEQKIVYDRITSNTLEGGHRGVYDRCVGGIRRYSEALVLYDTNRRENHELLTFLQPYARVLEATIQRDPETEWGTGNS